MRISNIVIQQSNLTVMTRYEDHPKDTQRYQSEAALEEGFIRQLVAQGYERPDLRNKQDLIEQFIERMTPTDSDDVMDNWEKYVAEQRAADLQRIIDEEKLKPAETKAFMDNAFEEGYLSTIGMAITKILPPMPLFGGGGIRMQKKRTVIEKLQAFFTKYFNL